jgi:CO/xanthine dehydrogenase Mo-binding subunit
MNKKMKKKRAAKSGREQPRPRKPRNLVEEFDMAKSNAERDAIVAREVAAAAAYVPKDPEEARLTREAMAKVMESRAKLRGRPRIGQGAAVFNVTMERSLLKDVDAFAKRNHMTRAAVIARGVELIVRK